MSARDAASGLVRDEDRSPRAARERAGAEPSGGAADAELVARAQKGDKAAMRQLVERHQRRVYQLALGIVKSHHDALDVVQDTFVKVHQHLPSFKGDAQFFTWVYRIAYNVAVDALRRRSRGEHVEVDDRTLTDEAEQYEPWSAGSHSPQTATLRGELSRELRRALDAIGESHRAILLLREVDGLSYEELAETLGIPKGTVMSRLFHARRKMQAALGDYLGEDAPGREGGTR